MAKSQKGVGSPLLPLAIAAVAVVAAMVAVFTLTGTEPPEEATIIPEDVNAEPAGGGDTPEADVADTVGGATEQGDPTTSPPIPNRLPSAPPRRTTPTAWPGRTAGAARPGPMTDKARLRARPRAARRQP